MKHESAGWETVNGGIMTHITEVKPKKDNSWIGCSDTKLGQKNKPANLEHMNRHHKK